MKRRILAALAAVLMTVSLGGCGVVATANKPVTINTVADARNVVYAVKSGYAALLVGMTAYVNLPACEKPGAPTLCSNRDVVVQLAKAQAATSASINNAEEAILKTQGGVTSYLSAAVGAAQAAYDSLKAVTTTYNIGGSS